MITLQLTNTQYSIVKAAVEAYSDGLMKAIEQQEPAVTIVTVNSPVTAQVRPAKYGLKKDGTPRKAPGRKKVRS